MTSSNGNIFRVTGHLCGEFTGHWWIPHTMAWFVIKFWTSQNTSRLPSLHAPFIKVSISLWLSSNVVIYVVSWSCMIDSFVCITLAISIFHFHFHFHFQRPVTRSFDVFFDLRPNKRLSKQSWGWRFEKLSLQLWRHSNVKDDDKIYLTLVERLANSLYMTCTNVQCCL